MEKNYTEINLGEKTKSRGPLIIFIIFFLLLLAALGTYLFMRTTNQQSTKSLENFVTPTAAPTISPTPGIEQEINNIDLGTDSAEFESIQQDIDQL